MSWFPIAIQEFRYMFWSIQTLIVGVGLLAYGAFFTANGAEYQIATSGGNILINAPTTITLFLLLSSVASVFFIPSYMANAVLKDADSQFDAILFSTPISKNDYMFGRFIGAFVALMLVMAAGPLGMFIGAFWPWALPETLAPTNVSHYLIAYFGFLLPTMLFVSTLVFAVASLSRSMLHCYMTVLGLFILYTIGLNSTSISALWDPFMVQTFNDQIAYWTITELNSDLIGYTGKVLANRFIWLIIAISLFGFAYLRFSFRKPVKVSKRHVNTDKTSKEKIEALANMNNFGTPKWSMGSQFYQFLYSMKFEISAVFRSQPFLLLIGFSLFLLVMSLSDRVILYDVDALPVTRILMSNISESLTWTLLLVTTFYGADIVWRDRENKFNEVVDAAPAKNWVFVASKVIALFAVIYSILIVAVVVAVLTQFFNGYHDFEIGLYFQRVFWLSTTFIFLAVLSVFFQVLVKSRFLGIILMGLFFVVTLSSIGLFGFEHPLLRYGMGGVGGPYSDMNNAGRFVEASIWIKTYQAAMAGILVMLTYVLWNRGTLQPLKYRLKNFKAFKTMSFIVPLLVLMTLLIGSGSFIYYNTNVLNKYLTRSDVTDLQVGYEQKFRQYEDLPMPSTTDVKVNVDIYPFQQRVETQGVNILENKTDREISTVHIVFSSLLAAVPQLELEGASLESSDELYHYYIFKLDTPMQPGEKRSLTFKSLIHNEGFKHRSPDVRLVRNGTFLENEHIAPHIGFDSNILIRNKNQRRAAGLKPLAPMPKLEDKSQYMINGVRGDADFINFEATVSTVLDQTAVTSGYLQNEWIEGDRRYFTYKMDKPIVNIYSFLSAEYEILRDEWKGVDIEIFYHKPHHHNIKQMMESTKDSLTYFSQVFGPYQFKQIRIMETPAYRHIARSFPNTVSYSEDLGFLADSRNPSSIDVPYYVTAHEVAHQWWAHQVVPAAVQGGSMLTESLSQYSALLVMQQKYGKDHIRKFLKYELDSYLSGRGQEAGNEVPLLKAEAQEYIFYRKGAVILYALKDYLGEVVVNNALRKLVNAYAFKSPPYPTTSDFVSYLKQEAGPEYENLIADFVEKITLYDLKITSSSVTEMNDGRFKVTLNLEAEKYYSDGLGNQSDAVFDIPVDIGLFLTSPDDSHYQKTDVLMLEKKRVADGKSSIEIVVDQKPVFAGIDPYNKLIDRNSDDNIMVVSDEKEQTNNLNQSVEEEIVNNEYALKGFNTALQDYQSRIGKKEPGTRLSYIRTKNNDEGEIVTSRFVPKGASGGRWFAVEKPVPEKLEEVKQWADNALWSLDPFDISNVKLIKESEDTWTFEILAHIELNVDSKETAQKKSDDLGKAMIAEMLVTKKEPHFKKVKMFLSEPFNLNFMVKITQLTVITDLVEAWKGGPLVVSAQTKDVRGSIGFFKKINDQTWVKNFDFKVEKINDSSKETKTTR